MDDIKAKQQIIDKIKESTNILVTVSDNPTVDALSSAIGLTLLIDKLDKHGTAIFSGVVPPAIAFLEPEKILDDTTDSLRDFIIALDKEKADHLRYKVEGESVKIFITPYKTTITSDDLEFSQGDYNVELIIALGVDNQDHLDRALENHGTILHDATVVTITAGDETSTLGGIDWHDDQASSLSEMVAGLAEALKSDKKKSLVDAQVATAFLTGIVAQTERFSNRNTTAKVMTVASQLMAAGADQQLIATKLAENHYEASQVDEDEVATVSDDGTLTIQQEDQADRKNLSIDHEAETPAAPKSAPVSKPQTYSTPPFETLEEMDRRVKAQERLEAAAAAKAALNEAAPPLPPLNLPISAPEPEPEILAADVPFAPLPPPPVPPAPAPQAGPAITTVTGQDDEVEEPTFSGTLNATTEQAADDARRAEEASQNHTILTHSYVQQPGQTPDSAVTGTDSMETPYILTGDKEPVIQPPVDPLPPITPINSIPSSPFSPAPDPAASPFGPLPAPEPLVPPAPAAPTDFGLPMPPPLPDFSQGGAPLPPPPALPPIQPAGPYAPEGTPVAPAPAPGQSPEILGDILAPDLDAPDSTAFGGPAPTPTGPYAPPPPPPTDNGQFKIPGQ